MLLCKNKESKLLVLISIMILLPLLLLLGVVVVVVFMVRLNWVMTQTPQEALEHLGQPLTRKGVRSVDARIKAEGIDFRKNHPPRLDRRYIIVGGSGWLSCVSLTLKMLVD